MTDLSEQNTASGEDGWIKASASSANGSCVEMRQHEGQVEVRDSKDQNGPALRFTGAEFRAWLDGAAKHEFDHLA